MVTKVYSVIESLGIPDSALDLASMIQEGEVDWMSVQEGVDLYYDSNQVEYDSKMDFLNQIQQELNCLE